MYQMKCAVWEFTLKCNLRCTHCGSSAGMARRNELDTAECRTVCEQLAEVGCKEVCLMGGEPFLRDDWFEVGQCIKDLGMNLTFVSNGTVLDGVVERIGALDPKVVGISLDGMKEAHDSIRGTGTWELAVGAIEELGKNGIRTTVITSVSKVNFSDLPRMKDMLSGRGLNWQIQMATPFGNFRQEQMMSMEQFYASGMFIAKQMLKSKENDLRIGSTHCYGYHSKTMPEYNWKGCTAGIKTIGLTSDGDVVGCLSIGNDKLLEGNLREKRLDSIWNDPNAFAYNRRFEPSQLGPNCAGCAHGPKCKGGCNSTSYALTKMFHNDPYCFMRFEKTMLTR